MTMMTNDTTAQPVIRENGPDMPATKVAPIVKKRGVSVTHKKILDIFKEMGGNASVADVVKNTGANSKNVSTTLNTMVTQGKIFRIGHGKYSTTKPADLEEPTNLPEKVIVKSETRIEAETDEVTNLLFELSSLTQAIGRRIASPNNTLDDLEFLVESMDHLSAALKSVHSMKKLDSQ